MYGRAALVHPDPISRTYVQICTHTATLAMRCALLTALLVWQILPHNIVIFFIFWPHTRVWLFSSPSLFPVLPIGECRQRWPVAAISLAFLRHQTQAAKHYKQTCTRYYYNYHYNYY